MPRPSEDELIARYFAPLAGPGSFGLCDDAALATPRPGHDLVFTKDMLVAGGHFFADDPPDAIARKALRVNLSDLAAKGAKPLGFLLGLGLPTDWSEPWLAGFIAGLADDAWQFGCPLLGGDTIAMPSSPSPGPLTISITAFGEVAAGRMVPRTGTQPGDVLYVTGTIGDAAIGLQVHWARPEDAMWIDVLDPAVRKEVLGRYQLPQPRLALSDALVAHARAAMDVSDGLIGDLAKMLGLEGLTAILDLADVPISAAVRAAVGLAPRLLETALTGGDDYEIICAVDKERASTFEAAAESAGVAVAPIGMAIEGTQAITIRDASGARLKFERPSFAHFD